jgi:hypothetical protein
MPRLINQAPTWSEVIARLEELNDIIMFNDAKIDDYANSNSLYDIGQIDAIVHDLNVAKYMLALLDLDIDRHSKSPVKRLLHNRVALLLDFVTECEVRNNSLYGVLAQTTGHVREPQYAIHPADFPF